MMAQKVELQHIQKCPHIIYINYVVIVFVCNFLLGLLSMYVVFPHNQSSDDEPVPFYVSDTRESQNEQESHDIHGKELKRCCLMHAWFLRNACTMKPVLKTTCLSELVISHQCMDFDMREPIFVQRSLIQWLIYLIVLDRFHVQFQ